MRWHLGKIETECRSTSSSIVNRVSVMIRSSSVRTSGKFRSEGEPSRRVRLLGSGIVVIVFLGECSFVIGEFGERDRGFVECFVFGLENLLRSTFTDDDTSVTPREVVELPERVNREEEGVDGIGELQSEERGQREAFDRPEREAYNVDDQPSDELPLSLNQEDDSLETVNRCDQDQGDHRNLTTPGGDSDDEVDLREMIISCETCLTDTDQLTRYTKVAGRMMVPRRSMKTTNRIPKKPAN